jgi:hypothetical protein
VIVVLSSFLDDAVTDCVIHAARRGERVLAVDMLPPVLAPDPGSAWGEVVRQVIVGEHRARLSAMRAQGVPVIPWADGVVVAATLRRIRRRR